jgi:putative ABC transport system substrate-binding protein
VKSRSAAALCYPFRREARENEPVKRRDFITLLGGAAVAWPFPVCAQQPAMPVIGFVNGAAADLYAPFVQAFRQGLGEAGYVEGQNVAIEFRWAEGRLDQLPALLSDLIRRKVAVIAATSTPAALAARKANTTVPMVFTTANDPVRLGLVESLSRPGGNMTGATQLNMEVAPKRLEIFHELMPSATEFAHLVNLADPIVAEIGVREMDAAARTLGLKVNVLNATSDTDFEKIFATLAQQRHGGLLISTDVLFTSWSRQLGALAARYAVPAIYQGRDFAASGGLMSYGGSTADSYRLAGAYAGRILKGEKPGDLPIQQSSKVEMIINLKTAKALGLTFPITLLGRADEVIE